MIKIIIIIIESAIIVSGAVWCLLKRKDLQYLEDRIVRLEAEIRDLNNIIEHQLALKKMIEKKVEGIEVIEDF